MLRLMPLSVDDHSRGLAIAVSVHTLDAIAGVTEHVVDRRVEVGGCAARRRTGDPGSSRIDHSPTERNVEETVEREMPTVTVLAWCLMASIGRVSSSMPRVRAAARSSSTTAGVPTLPYSIW